MNHCNSLVDAAVTISSCPRDVRLTCKETLLTGKGVFPFFIRCIESVPFQRRMDYTNGKKVDNSGSISILLKELSNGCCIGLFPEGLCRYKPQLSQFRTGVARTAIDYVINAIKERMDTKYKYIHIVPVGITYLHRDMFRSDVSVRINNPIKIDQALLESHGVIIGVNDNDKDVKYAMAKQITENLYQSILDSTLTSPDWHSLCLSHLSRQIAFPESSSPRLGTFCAQYIDLTRKFNKIFVENKENEGIKECLSALDVYWRLLYFHGLKDNRILKLQQKTSKISILFWVFYRGIAALVTCGIAAPGFILGLPLVIAFRLIQRAKIKAGLANNYDEVAQTKMAAILVLVPLLTVVYTLLFGNKLFAFAFPFILWMTMRLSQDGAAQARSFRILLKMLFLSDKAKRKLIDNRKKCQTLIGEIVRKYNVGYDEKMIDERDLILSKSIFGGDSKRFKWLRRILRSLYYGRVKNDWNETIRLYDVPVDEFHLLDKHQEEVNMSYTM